MIFPDWGTAPDTAPEEALPLFREWAVDWDNRCFALRRGEPYLVSGETAVSVPNSPAGASFRSGVSSSSSSL